jgi:hypothetical protein
MRLKDELGVEIFINANGALSIKQFDWLNDGSKVISMSVDQFSKLACWVDEHYEDIVLAWNDGIDLEDDNEVNS